MKKSKILLQLEYKPMQLGHNNPRLMSGACSMPWVTLVQLYDGPAA